VYGNEPNRTHSKSRQILYCRMAHCMEKCGQWSTSVGNPVDHLTCFHWKSVLIKT
jgi:hypothetical protein